MGEEYISKDFFKYFKENGIQQQFTMAHTPQQNEVAERKNKTLVDYARSMIKGKKFLMVFRLKHLVLLYI
jgi:transposase InsO family protein